MGNELDQSPFHPVDEFMLPLRSMAKNFLSVIAQDHKEPAIGGSNWGGKLSFLLKIICS